MSATIVCCAKALVEGEERSAFAFAIDGGRIAAIDSEQQLRDRYPDAQMRTHGSTEAVVPGFVNGHSHAYQILMRGWADDLPFERWRRDALYRVVPQLTPQQVYWTFRLAFDEMLGAGITTVVEFFYLNGGGNAHAREAIRAAEDAGIRLVLARTWMDAEYAPPAFRETVAAAQERTLALMQEFPGTHICVAPHSLHAASHDMIRASAGFAHDRDCMMHIHAAEARYEGAETLRRYGATPIRLLERLGALNERTVAVHAIYIDDQEKELLAHAGARVIHNPMTNQYLGDGVCDVSGLLERGVRVGLGTDADVKPSIIEEMRAAAMLQKVLHLDASALGARTAIELATQRGADALRIEGGTFRPGTFADYMTIDVRTMDPWVPLCNQIVYRGENGHVLETYVGGKRVHCAGQPAPADAAAALAGLLPELRL